ncbi:hypothetical protein, partial [Gemmiger sp.]|uniref:hypothetical protein n=1 Tax=Gemmiger sp. TaxID=2049027 RepID=UPI003AEF3635
MIISGCFLNGKRISTPHRNIRVIFSFNIHLIIRHRQLSSMHENSQTEGVGNEVRQRASKDLANNLNLAMVTIYTFLLFF